jgi:hypothetical protein
VDTSHKDFDSDLALETTHSLTRLTIAEAARYASKNPVRKIPSLLHLDGAVERLYLRLVILLYTETAFAGSLILNST